MSDIIKTLVALAKKRMTQHEKAQKGKQATDSFLKLKFLRRCVTS